MTEHSPRALHLYDLSSLMDDLIASKSILLGNDEHFQIDNNHTRNALAWYRDKGVPAWTSNVTAAAAEALVDATIDETPLGPFLSSSGGGEAQKKSWFLTKVEAHRFAGLHTYGTPRKPPENYVFDVESDITLFEGRNGSGKTSLLNAIVWGLTAELLRPQRKPEAGDVDFDCVVGSTDDDRTQHRITPLTPLPDVSQYRPDKEWVPSDTWVELTFQDQNGQIAVVRREQSRSSRGKVKESVSGLDDLAIDPISFRIGSTMPGLLQHIQVGSESELGRAVAQLTGLRQLIDLSAHARRAKGKIGKEFVKAKSGQIDEIDAVYSTAKSDLEALLLEHPKIELDVIVPPPSSDRDLEQTIQQLLDALSKMQADAFSEAKNVLGNEFDPENEDIRIILEQKIVPALNDASQVGRLDSMRRLKGLGSLSAEELENAEQLIDEVYSEASQLLQLAANPDEAARIRLYSRVASWNKQHPQHAPSHDTCAVCSQSIVGRTDSITGLPISDHIRDASQDAELISQTISDWQQGVLGMISAQLPAALSAELTKELPDHPTDLIRESIVDELFRSDAFSGILAALKDSTGRAFDELASLKENVTKRERTVLPAECSKLQLQLNRLGIAIEFAKWRKSSDTFAKAVIESVLGSVRSQEGQQENTLIGKLQALHRVVQSSKPITDATKFVERLNQQIAKRREKEQRITAYELTSNALDDLIGLGDLADEQVDQLRISLAAEAVAWRDKIYLGAYPSTAHSFVDTEMGKKGELSLIVESGGVSAPAQHVTNASALRATLVAFYLAFWEHVLEERGGLRLVLLDDPQELLDSENRERLAHSLFEMKQRGAQIFATSYDARFAHQLVKASDDVDHREVEPATQLRPTIKTIPHILEIQKRASIFQADSNQEESARQYVESCRVFLETKLEDVFEDPAFSGWVKENSHPSLAAFVGRLRQQIRVKQGSMFQAQIFAKFCDHPAMQDGSSVIDLMNKSHHGRRAEIRANDVYQCLAELEEIVNFADKMFDECCRWRRRDASDQEQSLIVLEDQTDLDSISLPASKISIYADLAAFTSGPQQGASQEPIEHLLESALGEVSAFYLRRENFGFAAPAGSIALVQAESDFVDNGRLVIAQTSGKILARRLLRSINENELALTTEIPDPTKRAPKTLFLSNDQVRMHRVIGVIFDHSTFQGHGDDEAIQVDAEGLLANAELAFRVRDKSAVPLALNGQLVLGGKQLPLDQIASNEGKLVAISLSDGSEIFKRVGRPLPNEMKHLIQLESIGGLGNSTLVSLDPCNGSLPHIHSVRSIFGVLYKG